MAGPFAEGFGVIRPQAARAPRFGLLEPAVGVGNIHLAVAVDVAKPQAVSPAPRPLFGDGVDDPLSGGIRRIGARVAEEAAATVDKVWFAVAIDIFHQRDFLLNQGNDIELIPAAKLILRIDIEVEGVPDSPHTKLIGPAVAGEITREVLHAVIGIFGRRIHGLREIDLPRLREIGTQVVVGSGGNVVDSIVVEIGGSRTPGIVEVIQLLHAEVGRDFFERQRLLAQVAVGDVPEPNLSGTADIERHRAVLPGGVLRSGAGYGALVQEGTNNRGVEDDFHPIPFIGLQARCWSKYRQASGSGGGTPATPSGTGVGGGGGWRKTKLATCRA